MERFKRIIDQLSQLYEELRQEIVTCPPGDPNGMILVEAQDHVDWAKDIMIAGQNHYAAYKENETDAIH